MHHRLSQFPRRLASRARLERLAGLPALLAHPDWSAPAPVAIWLHGRTASKEIDPGRYLRWLDAGVAACALDMPGHGERADEALQDSAGSLDVIEQALREIDRAAAELAAARFAGLFRADRMALGGMSLGGMAALRRLCDPHPFRCAAVEAAAGDLRALYASRPGCDEARLGRVDPLAHIESFRPIPLLAIHSRADDMVPFAAIDRFLGALSARYQALGSPPGLIELLAFDRTGSPREHLGFGVHAHQAKTAQAAFLARHLLGP
jgi:dienelactone hydrolase